MRLVSWLIGLVDYGRCVRRSKRFDIRLSCRLAWLDIWMFCGLAANILEGVEYQRGGASLECGLLIGWVEFCGASIGYV